MKKDIAFFDGKEDHKLPADAILMIMQRVGFPLDDDTGTFNFLLHLKVGFLETNIKIYAKNTLKWS